MIGIAGSAGSPFSPWQALQTDALSSTESAQAAVAAKRSAAITTLRNMNGNPSHRANAPPIARCAALGQTKRPPPPDCDPGRGGLTKREVYSIVEAMMLLPRLESIWALPPEPTTTYCLPSTM